MDLQRFNPNRNATNINMLRLCPFKIQILAYRRAALALLRGFIAKISGDAWLESAGDCEFLSLANDTLTFPWRWARLKSSAP